MAVQTSGVSMLNLVVEDSKGEQKAYLVEYRIRYLSLDLTIYAAEGSLQSNMLEHLLTTILMNIIQAASTCDPTAVITAIDKH